jgi:hypothetical protein
MTGENREDRRGLWDRLGGAGRGNEQDQNLDTERRPRTTRLNRRAFFVIAIVIIAVLLSAVATLREADRWRRETRDEGPHVATAAPDPFWRSQPDGVAVPYADARPSEPPELPLDEPSRPVEALEDPQLRRDVATESREDASRLRRAYEAPPLVPGFGHAMARADGAERQPVTAHAANPGAATPFDALAFTREPDPTVAQNNQASKRTFLETSAVGAEYPFGEPRS